MTRDSYARNLADVAAGWGRELLDFVLPAPCLACHAAIRHPPSSIGLCEACEALLQEADPDTACPRCGAPLRSRSRECRRCRQGAPSYRRLLWGWHYRPPCERLIAGLKFGRLDYLGRQLGLRLAARFAPELASIDAVVPLPLHWTRRLWRGYDQAEMLGQAVADALGKPLWTLLRRRRPTRTQSLLALEARSANVQDAFAVRRAARRRLAAGARLLLVDDVATSGSTLDAATRMLLAGGAAEVLALVAARTPAPGE